MPTLAFKDFFEYQLKGNRTLLDYVLTEKIEAVDFIEEQPDGTVQEKKYTAKEFDALSVSEGRKAIMAVASYLNSLVAYDGKGPEKLEEPFVYELRTPITIETTRQGEDKKKIQVTSITFQVKTIGEVKKILSAPTSSSPKDFFLIAASCKEKISPNVLWSRMSLEDGLFYFSVIYYFFLEG